MRWKHDPGKRVCVCGGEGVTESEGGTRAEDQGGHESSCDYPQP